MDHFLFILKTAFKDSRRHRTKLAMFMSSIILGIAALVAINSFNENLVKDIEKQSASLLGADIVISGNKEISDSLYVKLDSIPGENASEFSLFSMGYIPSKDESQFVNIKAIKGNFPFYGKLKTEPVSAAEEYKKSKIVLVDNSMLLQYDLQIGDEIKLGETTFKIGGSLFNAFGSLGMTTSFAPSIYVDQKYLAETKLITEASLVNYSYFKKVDSSFDCDDWKEKNKKVARTENMRISTIAGRKENLKSAYKSLNYFLNLVALISLLLGCIGIASSVYIYVKTKIPTIAIMRCLGMKSRDAFLVYFIQIAVLGLIGVLLGVILGSIVQLVIPRIMSEFLPFEVITEISYSSIVQGLIIGSIITLLFASLPLVNIRNVSPLMTLRSSTSVVNHKFDTLKILIVGLILISLFVYLFSISGSLVEASIFTLGLVLTFLILYGVASIIIYLVKNYLPKQWSFVFRQGLSNLFRPNNQTSILLISIGLGTMILTTLFIVQGLLLSNVSSMESGNQPNVILYGITSDQTKPLADLTDSLEMPIIQQVPIVTMKLDSWKGKTKREWAQDTTNRSRRWASNREIRASYRSYIESNEKLLKGEFRGSKVNPGDSIFISLGEDYAEGMKLDLGDEMIWNVQGTKIKTYVSSIREIDYANMNARFFILFPEGVLEKAPQFQVLITKTKDDKQTAEYRSAVVKAFPNISVVDLGSILITLNDILAKISYVIKFMALFSILTGLIVLLSSLLLSKYQRVRESVLLRTLGATRNQILKINATEYFILGSLASITGIFLALITSYLIATLQLNLDFNLNWWPIFGIYLFITLLTVGVGIFNSKEVVSKSPLEVLRNELS